MGPHSHERGNIVAQYKKQNIFTRRITMRQMEPLIKHCAKTGKAIFFFGGAGLGKSQKIAQLAAEMFPDYIGTSWGSVCDIRLSDKEPADLAGVQIPVEVVENGKTIVRTVYATPSFWPTDPNWRGFVFLDELTNASPACQQAAYQIMLDHRIGEFTFPKGSVFIGAGNRPGDNGATTELLGPLVNRMMVVEVDYNATVWIEDFAVPQNVHQSVVTFIKKNPDKIYTGHLVGTQGFEGPCFSSPRQLVDCGNVLDDYDAGELDRELAEVAIQGLVGSDMVTALMDHHVRSKKLPDAEDVLSGKVTEHKNKLAPNEIDLVSVLVYYCLRQLKKDVMDIEKYSNDEFLSRVANFLKFMMKNHIHEAKDSIIAVSMKLMRQVAKEEEAILDMNPLRGDNLITSLAAKSEDLSNIVAMYMARYASMAGAFK